MNMVEKGCHKQNSKIARDIFLCQQQQINMKIL